MSLSKVEPKRKLIGIELLNDRQISFTVIGDPADLIWMLTESMRIRPEIFPVFFVAVLSAAAKFDYSEDRVREEFQKIKSGF